MPKIWYISKYSSTPEQSGPQRQFSLAENFNKLGYRTSLLISRSNSFFPNPKLKHFYSKTDYNGLSVITLNGPIINLGFSMKRIYSWIIFELNLFRYSYSISENERPDIIIVSSLSFFTLLSGVLLKKRFKSKLIIEIRDIWPLTLIEIGHYRKNNLFIKMLLVFEKISFSKADGIVGTMPKLDLYVSKVLNKPFNFACIPMGFSDAQLKSTQQNHNYMFLKKYISEKKFIVGYAGSIGKVNLVDEIVAVAKILSENREIFFAIFGDGPLREKLILDSVNLKNIEFFGSISKYDIIPVLRDCNLLISPINNSPLYEYGVSFNKWIDYMLCKRPILASYSGYQSIINEADCGFFIEANNPTLLAEKIISIKNTDAKQLDEMGERGYNYALKNHNYEQLSKDYLHFINSILPENK